MIYGLLFFEFFKIGLFAIGGGLVTIPFLFDLAQKYDWFTVHELMDMIAVSQSTPGPIGVNMATYAGFKTLGVMGGVVATSGLVLPSLIIVILVSKLLNRYSGNDIIHKIMMTIRPASIALIFYSGFELFKLSVTNWFSVDFVGVFFCLIYFYRRSPVFYIVLSAILGIVMEL